MLVRRGAVLIFVRAPRCADVVTAFFRIKPLAAPSTGVCYTRPPCAPCRPVWHEELSELQTPPPSARRQSSSATGGGAAVPWLGPSR